MPIGVENVQVVPADSQIDGIVQRGYLSSKEEIRTIHERSVFSNVDPHSPRLCIQDIQIAAVQGEGLNASPIRIRSRHRDALADISRGTIEQVSASIHTQHSPVH